VVSRLLSSMMPVPVIVIVFVDDAYVVVVNVEEPVFYLCSADYCKRGQARARLHRLRVSLPRAPTCYPSHSNLSTSPKIAFQSMLSCALHYQLSTLPLHKLLHLASTGNHSVLRSEARRQITHVGGTNRAPYMDLTHHPTMFRILSSTANAHLA
jgi:DNA-binding LytR/AlgR family response regulator